MSSPEEEILRRQARRAGEAAGALYRGEVWPIGTLVRAKGPKSKVTYRVSGHMKHGQDWCVEITPLQPGPGRSVYNTNIQYLRQVSE